MADYATAGGPLGLQGGSTVVRFIKNLSGQNRLAGQVMMMNEFASSNIIGDEDGAEGSFIIADPSPANEYARFLILLENIDNGEIGQCLFRGRVKAQVFDAAVAIVRGEALGITGSQPQLRKPTANDKIVGILKDEDYTNTGSSESRIVEFDGLTGFGQS